MEPTWKAANAATRMLLEAVLTNDRKEIACNRCGYWPCVCGEPEFEAWVSEELKKAEDRS